jgi:hypothetical protein
MNEEKRKEFINVARDIARERSPVGVVVYRCPLIPPIDSTDFYFLLTFIFLSRAV